MIERALLPTALGIALAFGSACGGRDDDDSSGSDGGAGEADAGETGYPAPRDDLVPPVGSAGAIDIATWNVENFPRTPETASVMADLITSLGLDLVAVQEIASTDAFDELVARLPHHAGILSSHTYGNGEYQKVGFIYRSDLLSIESGALLFENQGFDFPRPPLQVPVVVDDGVHPPVEFLAIVLHLKAGIYEDDRSRRRDAMVTLEAHMRDVVESGGEDELMVLGDFNEVLINEAGLEVFSPFLDAPDDYSVRTYDAAQDSYTYVPSERFYDHVITTAGLAGELGGNQPVVVHLEQQLSSYLSGVSDHVPVVVSMPLQ